MWPQILNLSKGSGVDLVWGTAPSLDQAAIIIASEGAAHVAEWEYGNEPGPSTDPKGLAHEFVQFKAMLVKQFPPDGRPLVGPDTGYGAWAAAPSSGSQALKWLTDFLDVAAASLDAAILHIYPFDHNDVGGDDHLRHRGHGSGGHGGGGGNRRANGGGPVGDDPRCSSEAGPGRGWCNYSRVMWPGPNELYDTAPLQAFAGPWRAAVSGLVKSLRVGETAAVNHGGWDNVTNSFVSGFWMVYELGWLAQMGYDVVQRQSLACVSNNGMGKTEQCKYGLLTEQPAFDATPDFWTSLLYKRVMGQRVLNTSVSMATPGPDQANGPFVPPRLRGVVRVYAHCTQGQGPGGANTGAVTIMYANPQLRSIRLEVGQVGQVGAHGRISTAPRDEYVLTPGVDSNFAAGSLQSKTVSLNGAGVPLSFAGLADLPPLEPR